MDIRYDLITGESIDFKNDIYTKIVYLKEGNLNISSGGKTDEVSSNEAIIIPPFTNVSFLNHQKNNEAIATFSYYIYEKEFSMPKNKSFIHCSSEETISKNLEKYFYGFSSTNKTEDILKKSMEYLIIYNSETFIEKEDNRINQKLLPLISYIENNHSQSFNISDMAKSANISESAVYKLFSEHLNESPKQYIRKCRISHATNLLLNTDKPISDIAIEAGFYDQFYFSKEFKKEFGVSPSVYRKK